MERERINSIKSKTEYLMQQYLTNDTSKMGLQNSHGGYMETGNVKFSVQWIIEQTGLTPSQVDTLIEDEVESSVIMSNMKSKITSKIACCLCLNGLEKLGDDLLIGNEHMKKITPDVESPSQTLNMKTFDMEPDDKLEIVLNDPKFGMFSLMKYHLLNVKEH